MLYSLVFGVKFPLLRMPSSCSLLQYNSSLLNALYLDLLTFTISEFGHYIFASPNPTQPHLSTSLSCLTRYWRKHVRLAKEIGQAHFHPIMNSLQEIVQAQFDPRMHSVQEIGPIRFNRNRMATKARARLVFAKTDEGNEEDLGILGEGGNGEVHLVRSKTNSELMACKILKSKHSLGQEMQILAEILPSNDRIIQFRKFLVTPLSTQVYYDYCDGGDLNALTQNYFSHKSPIPESFIWHCYLELSEAVAFIHYGYNRHVPKNAPSLPEWRAVIHRDIKPANILLRLPADDRPSCNRAYPSLVLADFGHASLLPSVGIMECRGVAGTLAWNPPEAPLWSRFGDIWTVGAVLSAIATDGKPPIFPLPSDWPRTEERVRKWEISPEARDPDKLARSPGNYSRELRGVVAFLLRTDPRARPNALRLMDSALAHVRQGMDIWEPLSFWAFGHMNRVKEMAAK